MQNFRQNGNLHFNQRKQKTNKSINPLSPSGFCRGQEI
jgi:hypothetical protein